MAADAERSPSHAAALAYLARGWSVLPVRHAEKRPAVLWQEFQHRLAGEEEVDAWFRRWPDAGVGIVTGRISGLVVIDVDPRHGGEGSLADLVGARGPLPPTLEARTGGGGRHLYFAHPGTQLRNRVGIADGIDLRGDGGMIIAPPSIHPSGRAYTWTEGRSPGDVAVAPLPDWLLRLLRRQGRRPGHTLDYWRGLAKQGVAEGERNNTIASFAGHLLWHGVDPDVAEELLLAWNRACCRPPLSDDEVARTVASIARLHEREESGGD